VPGGRAGVPCRQACCAEHDGRTRQRRVIRREPHALGVDGDARIRRDTREQRDEHPDDAHHDDARTTTLARSPRCARIRCP